jgi:hypothetical protein
VRVELRQKYKSKIAHLKRKFEKRREDEVAGKPANHHGFEGAKVFDKTEFDKIKVVEIKISKVGNIEITEEDQSVFRLHPKMAIRERMKS